MACAWLIDALAGGRKRRLERARARVAAKFSPSAYRNALQLALRIDPPQAWPLFREHDTKVEDAEYAGLFDPAWVSKLSGEDLDALRVTFGLAGRLALPDTMGAAADGIAAHHADDGNALLAHLFECDKAGLLTKERLDRALRPFFARHDADRPWMHFFESVDPDVLPDLFETHLFRNELVEAAALADRASKKRMLLARSLESDEDQERVRAIELASALGDDTSLATAVERHAALIDRSVEEAAFERALEQVDFVEEHARVPVQRAAVLAALRAHYSAKIEDLPADGEGDTAALYREWSALEAAGGALDKSAQRREDAGDFYDAHQLYMKADLPGEARRVLGRLGEKERTPKVVGLEAEACERGGDDLGAARLYERAHRLDDARRCFARAGRPRDAARCLRAFLGEDAQESEALMRLLLDAGQVDEAASLCADAIEARGKASKVLPFFRRLLTSEAAGQLGTTTLERAQTVLGALDASDRREFDASAGAWFRDARDRVDRRYATTWGLDLGTTKCAVAIFDTETKKAVICPRRGKEQFPSTLALDRDGNERIGLSAEELIAPDIGGSVTASKRRIGTRAVYKLGDNRYRPEEIAARLIGEARRVVEDFLVEQMKHAVARRAQDAALDVPREWIDEAASMFGARLDRPRAVITIPAFFRNNQKHGSRDAGKIAGVDVARMLHEPTAACVAASRSSGIDGTVVVVDLGAGTLDLSAVEVDGNLFDVQRVHGDTEFGGNDLDAAIRGHLQSELRSRGVEVKAGTLEHKRLEIAAELMKIDLSSAPSTQYTLSGFDRGRDVQLELDRKTLERVLSTELQKLESTCAVFRAQLSGKPDRLLLVGGPMLSEMVSGRVEKAFGRRASRVASPRTAVACGAAIQGAVLDRLIDETVVLDVVPLPLGIRVVDQEDTHAFSQLIDKNARIPVSRAQDYTTREDNQTKVAVEVFQGTLDDKAKIGEFVLDGIPPAKKGVPQIEVDFSIDASCVLEVTAKDKGTGRSRAIKLNDTTLLSPSELDGMKQKLLSSGQADEARRTLRQSLAALEQLVEEARGADAEIAKAFEERLAAYRPTEVRPSAQDEATLAEMFSGSATTLAELARHGAPLPDLIRTAERLIDGSHADAADADQRCRRLHKQLSERLDEYRPVRGRIARWHDLLGRLARLDPDPGRRLIACHDAADFDNAVLAFEAVAEPSADQIHRYLDALGHLGDAPRYRAALREQASQLGLTSADAGRLDEFVQSVLPRVAWLTVDRGWSGSGFLVGERLVATNQHVVSDAGKVIDAGAVKVHIAGAWREVVQVIVPEDPALDLALVELSGPIPGRPFRLGYAASVRIGQRVVAVGFPYADPKAEFDESVEMQSGVVNKFDAAPGGARAFKVQLQASPGMSGGPLFNADGEVIGVLTFTRVRAVPGEQSVLHLTESSFALAADPLRALLKRAQS